MSSADTSWEFRKYTGRHIPQEVRRGPQSQPNWYFAFRVTLLVRSPMGLSSLLVGMRRGSAARTASPDRTGELRITSKVQGEAVPSGMASA